MSKGNTTENDVLEYVFKATAFSWNGNTNLYVSLHTADPGEGGSQTTSECAFGSYDRVTVSRSGSGWTVTGNTATCNLNTATANGSIISASATAAASAGCFIPLARGDSGVRSVQSVTFTSGTDVGLFALVLVRPLITSVLLEQTAPTEVECVSMQAQLPRIYDDAFLNLIVLPQGSLSGVAFHGEIETVWN